MMQVPCYHILTSVNCICIYIEMPNMVSELSIIISHRNVVLTLRVIRRMALVDFICHEAVDRKLRRQQLATCN